MADSKDQSGLNAIGAFTREELLECTTREDVREHVEKLREIIRHAPPAMQLRAIELWWNFVVAKPKQETDVTTNGQSILNSAQVFHVLTNDNEESNSAVDAQTIPSLPSPK
jgi:hypothetical protein